MLICEIFCKIVVIFTLFLMLKPQLTSNQAYFTVLTCNNFVTLPVNTFDFLQLGVTESYMENQSKGREFRLFSVVTKCYMLIFGKIYKLTNNTKKKLEAFAFSAIAFIYLSEKHQKPRNFYKS